MRRTILPRKWKMHTQKLSKKILKILIQKYKWCGIAKKLKKVHGKIWGKKKILPKKFTENSPLPDWIEKEKVWRGLSTIWRGRVPADRDYDIARKYIACPNWDLGMTMMVVILMMLVMMVMMMMVVMMIGRKYIACPPLRLLRNRNSRYWKGGQGGERREGDIWLDTGYNVLFWIRYSLLVWSLGWFWMVWDRRRASFWIKILWPFQNPAVHEDSFLAKFYPFWKIWRYWLDLNGMWFLFWTDDQHCPSGRSGDITS